MPEFTVWVQPGEQEDERPRAEVMRQRVNGNEDDGIGNMMDDIRDAHMPPSSPGEEDDEETTKAYLNMMASANKPLYEGAKISQRSEERRVGKEC